MAKRRNPRGSQLVRGFLLGMAYARGHVLTTAYIRKLGSSRATAKRDMQVIRQLVPVLPTVRLKTVKGWPQQQTRPIRREAVA